LFLACSLKALDCSAKSGCLAFSFFAFLVDLSKTVKSEVTRKCLVGQTLAPKYFIFHCLQKHIALEGMFSKIVNTKIYAVKSIMVLLERPREKRLTLCRRLLNCPDFMTSLGKRMPKISEESGVDYRWIHHVKVGDRGRMCSDRVDELYFYLEDQVEKINQSQTV
tara:strand:- start:522 stop:1016 length:495 start_codon:yes stop_codon:yes gene_type:complete